MNKTRQKAFVARLYELRLFNYQEAMRAGYIFNKVSKELDALPQQ